MKKLSFAHEKECRELFTVKLEEQLCIFSSFGSHTSSTYEDMVTHLQFRKNISRGRRIQKHLTP